MHGYSIFDFLDRKRGAGFRLRISVSGSQSIDGALVRTSVINETLLDRSIDGRGSMKGHLDEVSHAMLFAKRIKPVSMFA